MLSPMMAPADAAAKMPHGDSLWVWPAYVPAAIQNRLAGQGDAQALQRHDGEHRPVPVRVNQVIDVHSPGYPAG